MIGGSSVSRYFEIAFFCNTCLKPALFFKIQKQLAQLTQLRTISLQFNEQSAAELKKDFGQVIKF